jgi:hypothetical protein
MLFFTATLDGRSVWSVPFTGDYTLTEFAVDGRELRRHARNPPWYSPYRKRVLPGPTTPPTPVVRALVSMRAFGYLMTMSLIPDRNFARGLTPFRAEGAELYEVTDWSKVYDSVIELIDPATGSVVASRRFDEALDMSSGSSFVAAAEARGDSPVLSMYRISFRRP